MNDFTYNEYVTCPYDSTHVMKSHRFQYHLVSCRKKHLHWNYKICPFNALHHYPAEMEEKHLGDCPNRIALISSNFVDYPGKKPSGNVSVPPPITITMEGENWDEE